MAGPVRNYEADPARDLHISGRSPSCRRNLDAGLARAAVTDLPFAMALWAVFVGAGPRQGRLRRRHDVIRVGLIDMAES